MSTAYHESNLSAAAMNRHRALASLQEELEAVDWYQQRVDTSDDPELKEILEHNMNEEMEHAAMLLEWFRRRSPEMTDALRTYLFTEGALTEIEAAAEAGGEERGGDLRIRNGK